MKKIQMVDLKGQYRHIQDEVLSGIKDTLENTQFINGQVVKTFAASLELVKSGDCILEQNSPFQSLKIKSKDREDNK